MGQPGWEGIVIDTPAGGSRTDSPTAMSPRETAWLAYQALDQSDDIVLLLETNDTAATPDAVVVAANGAFRRASGFTEARILGRPVSALFSAGGETDALLTAIRERASLRTEVRCHRADGGLFVLGCHLMPAPEWTRGQACFAVLGRDITAQLEARQMHNSIQRLLAKVFASVDEAVAIVNAAGRIVMTNPRIDELLGYQPNELVGRHSLDLVAPDSRDSVGATIRRQLEQGTDQTYVAAVLRADGARIAASVTSVLVSTEDAKQFRILTLRGHTPGAREARTESAGRIRLVGLDDVRTAMGDRWHAMAQRALATADAVIRRRLGPQDSYSRVDDTSFLICFGALSEQEASFRAAVIAREIRDRLIGQGDDPDASHVRSIAAAIRFSEVPESPAMLHAALLDGLDSQLERIEREARRTLQAAFSGTACELNPIFGRNAGETIAAQVSFPLQLGRAVVAALAALPPEESRTFDMDGLLLGLAAQHAIAGMARGESIPILVNVRFDVFATRFATERYIATCRKIDQRVCGRLYLLLADPPEGLPKTRQLEWVNRLRPFCRGVGYQISDLANLASLDLSFSLAPVVSMPARVLATLEPEKRRTLIGGLHARRAKVLVRGIASEDEAASFRAIGADMIAMRRQAV